MASRRSFCSSIVIPSSAASRQPPFANMSGTGTKCWSKAAQARAFRPSTKPTKPLGPASITGNSEASFGPEDVRRLVSAYEAALELLRLRDRADSVCELVVAKLIQVYRKGERDPPRICATAITELGIPIPN